MSTINISWLEKKDKLYLKFEFFERFTQNAASKSVDQWKTEVDGKINEGDKYSIIFDTLNMSGFDGDARKIWQEQLKKSKHQVDDIWLISSNGLIKTAAKTMSLLAGYSMKTASNVDDIK